MCKFLNKIFGNANVPEDWGIPDEVQWIMVSEIPQYIQDAEYDYDNGDYCDTLQPDAHYICTRTKGHDGWHVAHGGTGVVLTWWLDIAGESPVP